MPHIPAPEGSPFDDGELYDILFEGFDYGLDFYLGLARAASGPVLDVACGTGRVMLPCLQAGVDVEGLDPSAAFLITLRTKADALGFKPKLYEADMRSFRLERRYALIMIPFNAIIHNLTTEDQIATLTSCREHLLPGGLLAFDTFFPGSGYVSTPDQTRDLELEKPHPKTGQLLRVYDTRSFDRVEQLQHSLTEVESVDAAGNVTVLQRSRYSTRWIYKSEMALLLRTAGFSRWEIHGGFDRHPLEKETDEMIVEARKGEI